MSTEAKLMREVVGNPLDDEPRLVLADWYEEHDNPRGQFIRAQCLREKLDWDDPSFWELVDLEQALLKQNKTKWLKELPKLSGVAWGSFNQCMSESIWGNDRGFFRRGFVELAALKNFKSWDTNQAKLKKYGLVSFVNFVKANPKCFKALAKHKYLRGVEFFQTPIDVDLLGNHKSNSEIQSLTATESQQTAGGQDGFQALTEIELKGLRSLDLQANRLGNDLEMLLSWDSLETVQWLNMGLNDLGDPHGDSKTARIEEFGKCKRLANLFALDLWANGMGPEHIAAFAKKTSMKRLVFLSLAHNRTMEDAGVESLLSGKFKQLRALNLNETGITDKGVVKIAESKLSAKLRQLNLGYNEGIGDKGITAIANSKYLKNLTHLNLNKTSFGEQGSRALIASETLNSIRFLNIGEPMIDTETLRALKKRFPKAVVQKPYD